VTLLTPNFADIQKAAKSGTPTNGAAPRGRGRPKIVADHEPVSVPGVASWTMPPIPPSFSNVTVNASPVAIPQPLKVALVGTAPSSRMMAPFNDPSWKIWACSPGNMNILPRVDAWFEIHGNLLWPECRSYGEPYIEWLKQQPFPIYMQDKSQVPNAIPFPMKEMVKDFGPYFFTSSFAWMMALAMKQGATEIALYGIDMASKDEYVLQRSGGHYFFTEAQRRGIKMYAPYESDIMQPPGLYGYSEVTPFGRKILARTAEIKDRLNAMRSQRDNLTHQITYLEGAVEDLDYVSSIWGGAQSNTHPTIDGDKPDNQG